MNARSILPADPVRCWHVCLYGNTGKCTHPEARHGASAEAMREWGMPCGPHAALMILPGELDPQGARQNGRTQPSGV